MQSAVDGKKEYGDAENDAPLYQQGAIGDFIIFPEARNHLVNVHDLGSPILLLIPANKVDDGEYQTDQANDRKAFCKIDEGEFGVRADHDVGRISDERGDPESRLSLSTKAWESKK